MGEISACYDGYMKMRRWGQLASTLVLSLGLLCHQVQARESKSAVALRAPHVDAFWQAVGVQKAQQDGSTETSLSEGIRRIDWPDGRSELLGFSFEGKPITYDRDGDNILWHVDLKALSNELQNESMWRDPVESNMFDFTSEGGSKVSYTSYLPGPFGSERTVLTLAGGSQINLFSEHALKLSQLQHLAWVVSEAPEKTFHWGTSNQAIFISDNLGEVKAGDGDFTPLGGLHEADSGSIYIRTDQLNNFDATAFILRHESGHALDAKYGWLSRSLTDGKGNLLFGSGRLAFDRQGEVDLKRSGYKSVYASSNANEDFAETHELLLRVREAYNTRNPEKDLFALDQKHFQIALEKQGFSRLLQEKMEAIVSHVYSAPEATASAAASSGASGAAKH